MKRHNRASLRVEELERRDVPSGGLSGTMPPPLAGHEPVIAQTSFQWGIGRGLTEADSTTGPVGDVRLRRIVSDAATLPGGSILMATPMETLSFNWQLRVGSGARS